MDKENNLQWNALNMVMIELYNKKQILIQNQNQNQTKPELEPIGIGGSCIDFLNSTQRGSSIYSIIVASFSQLPFNVSCDQDTIGGGWITVLRRQDGSVDFFRKWEEYKRGIGTLDGEYFIGLEKLHHLTKAGDQELLIEMEDFNGRQAYAKYDQFVIASEEENYKLTKLGKYAGDAGDDLRYHRGRMFSARDRDNDDFSGNCAETSLGGWWYGMCHQSNLMGVYNDTRYAKGINWFAFTGRNASLKKARMLIRTKKP
ncbi:GH23089 [Drosophila grimshawi]|uniref:GH23089 n=2 Tax=Drosophila grimshawi TaxID=7222 RepID=B4JVC0_DROGR|nr:GH23089 [Drosophila grimshawi]